MFHVIQFELLPLPTVVRRLVPISHLPPASHTRSDGEQSIFIRSEPADLVFNYCTRPNNAHLPNKHVEKICEFIDACRSQDFPKRSNTGVIGDFMLPLPFFILLGVQILLDIVGIGHHRSKFEYTKRFTVLSDTLLRVKGTALRFRRDYRAEDKPRHQANNDHAQRERYIESAFNKAVDQTVPGGLSDVLLLRNSKRAFPGFRR